MKYVNIAQKDSVDYEIHDSRIPQPELEDEGKALIVNDEGAYELKDISVDAYTKAETDSLLAEKADTTDVEAALAEKADADDVYDKSAIDSLLADKQDVLVSGQNIKTINSESLLGNTDIALPTIADVAAKQDALTAGENVSIVNNVISAQDTTYTAGTGLALVGNEFIIDNTVVATQEDLAEKQDKLVSGQNIKTINNESILGEGNIKLNTIADLPSQEAVEEFLVEENEGRLAQYTGPDYVLTTDDKEMPRFNVSIDDRDALNTYFESIAGDETLVYEDGEWSTNPEDLGIVIDGEDIADGDSVKVIYKGDGLFAVGDSFNKFNIEWLASKVNWSSIAPNTEIIKFEGTLNGETGTGSFVTDSTEGNETSDALGFIWDGESHREDALFIDGAWAIMMIAQWSYFDPALTITELNDQDKWCNYISKLPIPSVSFEINCANRFDVTVDEATYLQATDNARETTTFTYNEGEWTKMDYNNPSVLEGISKFEVDSRITGVHFNVTDDASLREFLESIDYNTQDFGGSYGISEVGQAYLVWGYNADTSGSSELPLLLAGYFIPASVGSQKIYFLGSITNTSQNMTNILYGTDEFSVMGIQIPKGFNSELVDEKGTYRFDNTFRVSRIYGNESGQSDEWNGTLISGLSSQLRFNEDVTLYFNTNLTSDEVSKLFEEAGLGAGSGASGEPAEILRLHDSNGDSSTVSYVIGMFGGYAITAGSREGVPIFSNTPVYSMMLGIPEGWIGESYTTTTGAGESGGPSYFYFESDYVTLVNKLISTTPFEKEVLKTYDIEELGIEVEGDTINGDEFTVTVADSEYIKYDLYKVAKTVKGIDYQEGDIVKDLCFVKSPDWAILANLDTADIETLDGHDSIYELDSLDDAIMLPTYVSSSTIPAITWLIYPTEFESGSFKCNIIGYDGWAIIGGGSGKSKTIDSLDDSLVFYRAEIEVVPNESITVVEGSEHYNDVYTVNKPFAYVSTFEGKDLTNNIAWMNDFVKKALAPEVVCTLESITSGSGSGSGAVLDLGILPTEEIMEGGSYEWYPGAEITKQLKAGLANGTVAKFGIESPYGNMYFYMTEMVKMDMMGHNVYEFKTEFEGTEMMLMITPDYAGMTFAEIRVNNDSGENYLYEHNVQLIIDDTDAYSGNGLHGMINIHFVNGDSNSYTDRYTIQNYIDNYYYNGNSGIACYGSIKDNSGNIMYPEFLSNDGPEGLRLTYRDSSFSSRSDHLRNLTITYRDHVFRFSYNSK